jgi:quercetin dioxygenase-like cupin family protein
MAGYAPRMEGGARTTELVPPQNGSALALLLDEIESGDTLALDEGDRDVLLLVRDGSGTLELGSERFGLTQGSAALVVAGEAAVVRAAAGLSLVRATAGPGTDRHAALGSREIVVQMDGADTDAATGSRSYRVLFGPQNGSTRATLFVGYVPPGRAPWHYHLYDEIVWVPEGPGRLHLEGSETELAAGSAFRLRPRQVHIVENASADRDMAVVGVFTPAGSPSAAYLPH